MNKKEAKAKAKEICGQHPDGIGASELLALVGEADFNAVLREMMKRGIRSGKRCKKEGGCNCGKGGCKRKTWDGE